MEGIMDQVIRELGWNMEVLQSLKWEQIDIKLKRLMEIKLSTPSPLSAPARFVLF